MSSEVVSHERFTAEQRRLRGDPGYQAERQVLGSLMADKTQLSLIGLSANDFNDHDHRQIFEAIRQLINGDSVCDALTVADLLQEQTGRKNFWLAYTVQLWKEVLAAANAPMYAEMVRKRARARSAVMIAQRLAEQPEADEAIPNAIRDLMDLSRPERDYTCHIAEATKVAADDLMAIADGKAPGIMTGIRDLDDALGGLHNEDLIVVAARPGMGKTAFVLNLALNSSVNVGVISGEQGRMQVGMRFLAMKGPISLHRMRIGKLHDEEWDRLTRAMRDLRERQIWIYDKPGPTIDEVFSQARQWKFRNNIGLLLVDYMQKIKGKAENKRLEVGGIAEDLKNLARELQIPVVALSQVNRNVESRPMGSEGLGRMPYMGDLSESGIIEQEADQVFTLYRPEVYESREEFKGLAYVNIGKNRHGPDGFRKIAWRGEYLQFGDLAQHEMQYEGHHDRWSPPR